MSKYIFNLPDIGEGIAEAEIVKWHVGVGDVVAEDDQIADVMTDKATVEMEAPVSGKIVGLAGEEGDIVAIGSMLVEIEVDGDVDVEEMEELEASSTDADTAADDVLPPEEVIENKEDSADTSTDSSLMKESEVSSVKAPETDVTAAPTNQPKPLATPAVRKRAADLGVDLSQVKAQGEHIRHSDLDAYLNYGSGQGYRPAGTVQKRDDEVIKVIGMRRKIAQNMAESKRNIPHFSYVDEIDMTELEDMRADLNANRGDRPKLTMLPLMIVAICKSLPQFPMLNATYDDEAGFVTRHGSVHLGMATQTDQGLMVPVLRDAQDLNVWQLASEIARLAAAARDGSATAKELSGSTLTLTSLGPLGGIATTPVINRPEVAIIGPNKIVERPMIIDGEIEARKLMNLSISCDHRVVDGYDAASYVQALKHFLETPVLLFAD
ncbi:2-oxo acid dehydrogenase subunit E2 [Parasphingorhabdus flavimaris]|uniref:Dihydrolipoamide acetyltransferase component of pyruvate dehydrogenase complex n=1 Tax=Parasphingorhabdus flavimaris TaxID=266812 RepID=A0ABX2N1L9_9SPHN|nr:dihydrolipoamide acetyltransferase family protein [Parasphingorhabdus flavimaris]NVD27491.1 2-oxo acid dehydrogenase subunit E2 [Parasphingorhabdus flavimaris]|tara:strand:- start:5504 stop:6814 length:1311 start_codon:yes stop_codon:yes gene_type:complete